MYPETSNVGGVVTEAGPEISNTPAARICDGCGKAIPPIGTMYWMGDKRYHVECCPQMMVGSVGKPAMTLLDALAVLLMSNPSLGRRPAEHSDAMRRAQEVVDAHAKSVIG